MGRIICAGIELAAVIVLDFRRAFGHNLVKDKVNRRQHLTAAAEILFHGNQQIVVFFLRLFGETFVFCLKEIRVGQAEAINALLHIAHGKAVVFLSNQIEDGLLYAIGILILIDHDGFIFFPQGKGYRRRRNLSFIIRTKYRQRKMLQIVEIQNIALFFRRLQRPAEVERQTCIDCRSLVVERNIFLNLFGLLIEVSIGKFFQRFLYSIAAFIKLFPHIGIQIFQIAINFTPHGQPRKFAHLPDKFIPFFAVRI